MLKVECYYLLPVQVVVKRSNFCWRSDFCPRLCHILAIVSNLESF